MDYLVEKATEIGVDIIIPLETQRSVVNMRREKAEIARLRWERIAVAASKQCGRLKLPVISSLAQFNQIIEEISEYDLVLFPCLHSRTESIREVLKENSHPKSIFFFVGPEGGFSPQEIESARINGCQLVSLGENVLKSDTAGLVILSILQYEYGGSNGN